MIRRIAALLSVVVAASVLILPGVAGAAGTPEPSLWIVDDATNRTYNVTMDGTALSSFATPGGAFSSIAVDPIDGTLWGTKEGTPTVAAKLVNYSRSGTIISELALNLGGTLEGVDISFDPDSDSFWLVTDEDDPTPVGKVFNVRRDGTVLSTFDAPDVSPQAIAYDGFDGTLWITDNAARVIFNVSKTGVVLRRIATNLLPFDGVNAPKAKELQGITVQSADRLWFTARRESSGGAIIEPGRYIQITKGGAPSTPGGFVVPQIVRSFTAATYDAVANNPTGIAYDAPRSDLDLGAASDFAVFALGGKLKIDDEESGVAGDVGLAAGSEQDFDKGLIGGALLVDAAADNDNSHEVAIVGGTVPGNLAAAASAAADFSRSLAEADASQTFGDIKSDLTITGGPGLNVVDVNKIELKDGTRLTLRGDATTRLFINIRDKLVVERSAIVLAGDLQAKNVVFNILGGDSTIKEGSVVSGIVLAPFAKVTVEDVGSLVYGSVIGGKETAIKDGGRVRSHTLALDAFSVGRAAALGVLSLPGSKAKIQDKDTTVTGDVGIGPVSRQDFDKGVINGRLVVDPFADNSHSNDVEVSGGTVVADLSGAAADARDSSAAAAALIPSKVFGDLKSTTSIAGTAGINVVEVKKIELKDGKSLTLSGSSSTRFIINVTDRLLLDKGAIILDGVRPENVLFNLIGSSDSEIKNSRAAGVFVLPRAKITVSGSSTIVTGALVSGKETVVKDGATVVATP